MSHTEYRNDINGDGTKMLILGMNPDSIYQFTTNN